MSDQPLRRAVIEAVTAATHKEIAEQLKSLGLEPWADGRSILDNKRPLDQHVAMVVSALQARAEAAEARYQALRAAATEVVEEWDYGKDMAADQPIEALRAALCERG